MSQEIMEEDNPSADTDLDVDAPDKVSEVLRNAAEMYYESSGELESAWQDRNAGKVWEKIAKVLEAAADRIDAIT